MTLKIADGSFCACASSDAGTNADDEVAPAGGAAAPTPKTARVVKTACPDRGAERESLDSGTLDARATQPLE